MSTPTASKSNPSTDALENAAKVYFDRRDRRSHPQGYFSGGDRWYPSDDERCWCCKFIREPSYRWPWSLSTHCRSVEHVAALMDVDATELRRAVRTLKKKKAVAA